MSECWRQRVFACWPGYSAVQEADPWRPQAAFVDGGRGRGGAKKISRGPSSVAGTLRRAQQQPWPSQVRAVGRLSSLLSLPACPSAPSPRPSSRLAHHHLLHHHHLHHPVTAPGALSTRRQVSDRYLLFSPLLFSCPVPSLSLALSPVLHFPCT